MKKMIFHFKFQPIVKIFVFNFLNIKNDIKPYRLFHEGNKFTKKVMISAVVSWNDLPEPFLSKETI